MHPFGKIALRDMENTTRQKVKQFVDRMYIHLLDRPSAHADN